MTTNKKIIILLVIAALAGAGFWTVRRLAGKKPADLPSGVIVDPKQQEFDDAIKKATALDQDMDGILDSEEFKYKTSVTSSDTDEDGLTDWQEIFNFKTNPLKADTDGDGNADGYEARRGMDPTVKGK